MIVLLAQEDANVRALQRRIDANVEVAIADKKLEVQRATKASPPLKTLAFVENEDSFTKKDVLSLCSNIKHVEELTLSLADEEDVDFDALSYRCRLWCKRLDELHFTDTHENILRLPFGVSAMRRYPNPLPVFGL